MMEYSDCLSDYLKVKVKPKKATNLTRLYSLNEYQKSFHTCVTFKVELVDTFNVRISYSIPSEAALIMDFDLNDFTDEINKALLGQSADYVTSYLIVMRIIMKKFNSRLIGICLDKEVEERVAKRMERVKAYEIVA